MNKTFPLNRPMWQKTLLSFKMSGSTPKKKKNERALDGLLVMAKAKEFKVQPWTTIPICNCNCNIISHVN